MKIIAFQHAIGEHRPKMHFGNYGAQTLLASDPSFKN